MSDWENYVVPHFLQQDITVDYLTATAHHTAAATELGVSEPTPYYSS